MTDPTPQPDAVREVVLDVLARHRVNYHSRNIGGEKPSTRRYTSCDGCDWQGGHRDEVGWEVHLADALVAARTADAAARLAAVEELADEFESNVDWSSGRSNYGDNEAWESAARSLRAALSAPTVDAGQVRPNICPTCGTHHVSERVGGHNDPGQRGGQDLWVISEIDVTLAGPPPEGEDHPERTPVGPFASRQAASDWAAAQVAKYGGSGLWECAPLRTPERP